MFQRNFFSLFVVVLVGILLAACQQAPPPFECTDEIGCVTIAPDESIKLRALQALSGGPATLGTTQSQVIELAIDERDGQLLGHPIEFKVEDSKCTSEGGANAALRVVSDPQVVGSVGTSCSGASVTASPIMSEAGHVLISGSATSPSLTSIDGQQGANWHPGYLRTAFNGSGQGLTAAMFAFQELGATKAATINDGDAFTKGLTGRFGQSFTALGGEIVLDAVIDKGDTDMRPVLEAVANSGAEFLFFPLFQPESDFIVLQVKEAAGLENIILMSSPASLTEGFINNVGEDGLGMYFMGVAEPQTPISNKLRAAYEAKHGEPPPHGTFAQGYDAANLLLHGIEAAAVQDEDGTLHIGRQVLRDTLYATSGLEGATGTLKCDEFGDCAASKFDIVRFDDLTAGLLGVKSNVVYSYEPEQ